MKRFLSSLLAGIGISQSAIPAEPAKPEDKWMVGRTEDAGQTVIIRALLALPDAASRKGFVWLMTISWDYTPREGGMPTTEVHKQMNDLEDAIEHKLEATKLCIQTLSRTGNGKKQWEYYITDREQFLKAFNELMRGKPQLPIKINFYEDANWQSLRDIHKATSK